MTSTDSATPTPETPTAPTPAEVRERAGLSRAEMADLFGMSEFGYSQWELGARRPGGPAHRLLFLLDRDTKATVAALRDAA